MKAIQLANDERIKQNKTDLLSHCFRFPGFDIFVSFFFVAEMLGKEADVINSIEKKKRKIKGKMKNNNSHYLPSMIPTICGRSDQSRNGT